MSNVTQAERDAIQRMDDNEYGREAESYFADEEEQEEDDADEDPV